MLKDDRFSSFEPIAPAADMVQQAGMNWPTAITLIVLMICVTTLVVCFGAVLLSNRRKSGLHNTESR